MLKILSSLYNKLIFTYPKITLGLVIAITLCFAYHIPKFQLSASSDTLVLENDQDLKYYREIKKHYGSDKYLIITYTPYNNDLFHEETIADLIVFHNKLTTVKQVSSVISMINAPLIQSPQISFADLLDGKINTLENPQTSRTLAKSELISSPLYNNLLISSDAKHTALLVNLKTDEIRQTLLDKRDILYNKNLTTKLNNTETKQLELLSQKIKLRDEILLQQEDDTIKQIRNIIAEHHDKAKLYLGGVPMIVVDSINFIHNDIMTFGFGVLCFIIVLLLIAFRSISLIIMAIIICLIVSIIMVGFLGWVEWPVTIVSSNFISLLLIITLSINIHLIVSYREFYANSPTKNYKSLLNMTVKRMFTPCFYTAITTIIAFASLMISDIRPVIDFGWMMTIGISTAFIVSFILFPILMIYFKPKSMADTNDLTNMVTKFFAYLVRKHHILILTIFTILTILGIIGITKLTVENRFIDYYKKSTEIYQGMELIDQNFGGTTPLDVIIDAPKDFLSNQEELSNNIFAIADETQDSNNINNGYWFNSFILDNIIEIHNYLDSIAETGKILSMATTTQLLYQINNYNPIDSFILNMAYQNASDNIKNNLFKPYISADGNQIRFSVRVFESSHLLKRDELLNKIHQGLTEKLNLDDEQIHLNGMLVLYNNILKSLFKSQILTLGTVFFVIWLMFIILFRNVKLATVTIIPNMMAAIIVLGIMGLFNIPLDIMTITIAAICVGIAVDDAIHYVHRFLTEFKKDHNYLESITRSHLTIGRAMYYTTVTITFGFSILIFSNFMPTIYFGILTGISMVIALLANITLLPLLIKYTKA